MGSPYDFFGARAHPAKEVELWNKGQLNGEQWANRLALRQRDGSWTSMTRTRPSQPPEHRARPPSQNDSTAQRIDRCPGCSLHSVIEASHAPVRRTRNVWSPMPRAPAVVAVVALVAVVVVGTGCDTTTERISEGGVDVTAIRLHYNNTFVIEKDGRRILVDTGLERDALALDGRLREAGIDPVTVDAVVLTHGHADHTGGARWLRAEYQLPIVVGAADDGLLESGGEDVLCPTDDMARGRLEQDSSERYAPFDADVLLDVDDTLAGTVGFDGDLVFLPSHTDGSLALVVGPHAFVGDLLRGDIFTATASVHFYMCDLDRNRRDIERLLDEHPEVTTVYPGHFGPLARAEVEALLERWPTP